MSSAQLETIFREFEQVSTVEENAPKVAGVGLGLAVCARIVQNLGGQLRVESKENVGSKFTFVIPFMLPTLLPSPPDAKSPMRKIGNSLPNGHADEAGLGLDFKVATQPRRTSAGSNGSRKSVKSEIESLITAMAASHMKPQSTAGRSLASDVAADADEPASPQLKNKLLAPFDGRTASRRDSNSSSRSSSFGAAVPTPGFTRNGIRRNVDALGLDTPSGSRSPSTSPTPVDSTDQYDVAIEFESESVVAKPETTTGSKSPALANYRDFKPSLVSLSSSDQICPLRVLVVEVRPFPLPSCTIFDLIPRDSSLTCLLS